MSRSVPANVGALPAAAGLSPADVATNSTVPTAEPLLLPAPMDRVRYCSPLTTRIVEYGAALVSCTFTPRISTPNGTARFTPVSNSSVSLYETSPVGFDAAKLSTSFCGFVSEIALADLLVTMRSSPMIAPVCVIPAVEDSEITERVAPPRSATMPLIAIAPLLATNTPPPSEKFVAVIDLI